MPTNKLLKAKLLEKLSVTEQRLSQMASKMKTENGPMTTEEATYVIAHQVGLDLTKYLEKDLIKNIRSLIPKQLNTQSPQNSNKKASNQKKQVMIKIDPSIPEVDLLLSSNLATDASRMANLYPKYYILENSIRIVVKSVLEKVHGPDWWNTCVKNSVIENVNKRKEKEKKEPWHGKRGQHYIFYSDFGDLKDIIIKNWSDFKDILPTQYWISQRLDELETPRNIMAHHNPVSKKISIVLIYILMIGWT